VNVQSDVAQTSSRSLPFLLGFGLEGGAGLDSRIVNDISVDVAANADLSHNSNLQAKVSQEGQMNSNQQMNIIQNALRKLAARRQNYNGQSGISQSGF
jgi:hypothetical protein